MDAVIETEDAILIFEFKLNGNAKEALAQIREKAYFAPYLLQDKAIYLAGANFDMEKRAVEEWTVSAFNYA
ncbi:MAG: hypothetical protein GY796_32205 [Chloroflexi bacterium]|nr:hypothetical protein [Chloroflexota bacterium]